MDDQKTSDPIDGEVVSVETETGEENQAVTLLNVESLIKGKLSTLETLRKQLGEERETLENIFANDPTFRDHTEQAKEANKVKSITKKEILKRPDVSRVAQKIKELSADAKDANDELSEYLQEFSRLSGGVNVIQGDDGKIHEIVYVAKLVRKN